jgi:hypothetical protein
VSVPAGAFIAVGRPFPEVGGIGYEGCESSPMKTSTSGSSTRLSATILLATSRA